MDRRRHFVYPDKDELVKAFAGEVVHFLEKASNSNRPIHIALSGGSTPLAIYGRLLETTTKADWSNIHIYWGDERCVSPENNQSNFGTANNILLKPLGLPFDQLHWIRGEENPLSEAPRYGQLLMDNLPLENGIPVFDWIWLGLGEDGHTASIFSDQMNLWSAIVPCVVSTHPQSGQKRISISGNLINAARRVSFIVAGKNKSQVVNEIVMKEGRYMEYPAFYVSPRSGNLEWFLDQGATSWL